MLSPGLELKGDLGEGSGDFICRAEASLWGQTLP